MRYLLAFLLPSLALIANDKLLITTQDKQLMKKEQTTITDAVNKDVIASAQPKTNAATEGTSDIMIVDPKVMSQDWVDAFQSLQGKKVGDVAFSLKDNSTLNNVTNLEVMTGGYLMLFTLKTVQGPKYKIVRTSDITAITVR